MHKDIEIAARYVKKSENAIIAGNEFHLSFQEYKKLVSQKRCAYSGLEFSEYVDGKPLNPWVCRTLDRMDNSIGYTKENTVAICSGINSAKSTWENPDNPLTIKIIEKTIASLRKRGIA